VIARNSCGKGGGGFLIDSNNKNKVVLDHNVVDGNSGTEENAHGGGFYLFGNKLEITYNIFLNNTVKMWGGGLYIGAIKPSNQPTTAVLSNNVFTANKAGDSGGGFFCDDGATCNVAFDVYSRNCGGNILLDGGYEGSGPTTTTFDHITNVFALTADCTAPGFGVLLGNFNVVAPDSHRFQNSLFWGNALDGDFATACNTHCDQLNVLVDSTMVQTRYTDASVKIKFGSKNVAPVNPKFTSIDNRVFTLQPDSPAAGKGAKP
jgi:hypothetical protein